MCFNGPISLFRKLLPNSPPEPWLLILGLDNAGKSTLAARLTEGAAAASTTPTWEATEKHFKIRNTRLQLWDLSGHWRMRQLWSNYYENAKAVIYVIDSKDAARLSEARCELCDILLNERLQQVPLLIVANKQDVAGALPDILVVDLLGLSNLEGRSWRVQECSALSGIGIEHIMDWIYQSIRK